MKKLFFVLIVIFILFFRGCFSGNNAQVIRTIDGDTIEVIYDKNTERVRLIGIDTPEMYTGKIADEASEFTSNLVNGRKVKLEFDQGKRDPYGRLLCYVFIGSKFLNLELVKNGFARVMTIEPNTKYKDKFEKAEIKARKKEIGLWDSKNSLKGF